MIRMNLRAALSALAFAGCAAVITGCGANLEPASIATTPGTLGTIQGTAFGGQQPISGAHIYVFAVGVGGYNTAATSLLTSTNGTAQDSMGWYVTTDSSGAFMINSSVSCTAGLSAYLYAYGGNPQLTSNSPSNNTAAGLLAPLGTCTGTAAPPSGTTSVNIDEVSTVVTAYALAGFSTDATHISSSGSTLAKTSVSNAMATALNILNLADGTVGSKTDNGAGTVPADKINALGDILASCVNSTGPSSANCTRLFDDTGVATTADTAAAAIAIARQPFNNVSDLYKLVGSQPVFSTSLSTPADWTLGLQYTAQQGNVSLYSTAVDSGGNVWVRGNNSANSQVNIAKYSPLGALIAGQSLNPPANSESPYVHLAIDSSDTVWSGLSTGTLITIPSAGTSYALASNTSCGITGTLTSAAFGSNGAAYLGEYGTTKLWQFTTSSPAVCQQGLTATGAAALSGYVAVEPDGVIVTSGSNGSNTQVFKYTPGSSTPWSSFNAGGDYVATDASKNIWKFSIIGGSTNDSLYVYPEAGGSSSINFYNGGLTQSGYASTRAGNEGVHIDGAGNAWVTVCPNNCGSASALPDILVGVTNANVGITPNTGLTLPYNETGANAVSLDGSGNVWIGMQDGTLLQFLGLATPVATPILYNQIGVRP